jgi:hypothetical protein
LTARRFPPWSVEETDACFMVRDKNGKALAHVYFENEWEDGRRPELPSRETKARVGNLERA